MDNITLYHTPAVEPFGGKGGKWPAPSKLTSLVVTLTNVVGFQVLIAVSHCLVYIDVLQFQPSIQHKEKRNRSVDSNTPCCQGFSVLARALANDFEINPVKKII